MRDLSALAACAALAALLVACGPAQDEPVLAGTALSSSLPAQEAMRPLLKRWSSALTREERAPIAHDLKAFLTKYPDDGVAPAAEALLGWIAIEGDDLAQGRKLAQRAASMGTGVWGDFAVLIDGAAKRREKDARGAIALLEPLLSKLIDPWARDLLDEELIAAAIAAGDAKLATRTMIVWLREAGDDERALVRARVKLALDRLSDDELRKIFDERATRDAATEESDIDLLVAARLAKLAIDTKDAVLARKLLETSGALLGDQGDAVAHLAAGAAAIRVDARTIGVLLSFRPAETRRRSAELASGIAWGLELPGSGARLAVRDDAGDSVNLAGALADLGRDGVAVVIAGVADEDATAAARFATEQHVPVIVIQGGPPSPLANGTFAFSLGASPEGFLPDKDPRFADGRLGPWITAHGSPPSFWAAAGRDAAVLARASVKDLPQASTEERSEVEARRKIVRDALETATASVPLWTRAPSP